MKMNEYQPVSTLAPTDIALFNGEETGTRKIEASKMIFDLVNLCGGEMHRMFYRGANLGSTVKTEQTAAIQNGSFKDLWIGDYWIINGVNWRIVDFDYWFGMGFSKFTKHHAVIMPDTVLASGKMNESATTASGYTGSQMYTTNMVAAKSAITSAFSSSVLKHREFLTNAASGGQPTGGSYVDSSIELPNEPMLFGNHIVSWSNASGKRDTISHTQLALFAIARKFLVANSAYWLRDPASDSKFVLVNDGGLVTSADANVANGIRPVFAIG